MKKYSLFLLFVLKTQLILASQIGGTLASLDESERMHQRLASKFKVSNSFVVLKTAAEELVTHPTLSQELYNVLYRQDVIAPGGIDQIVVLDRPFKRPEEERGFEIKDDQVILYIPSATTERDYYDLILNRYLGATRFLVEKSLRYLEEAQAQKPLSPLSSAPGSCPEIPELETLLISVMLGTEEERLEALHQLEDYTSDPRVQKKLFDLIFDGSPKIKDKALLILSSAFERKIEGTESIYFNLIQIARGKGFHYRRDRAIEALGYFRERGEGDPLVRSGLFTLLDLITSDSVDLRKGAQESLKKLHKELKTSSWQRDIRNVISQKIGHTDPVFQKEAIEMLSTLKHPAVFNDFLNHLQNRSISDLTKKEIISALPKVAEGVEFPLRLSLPTEMTDQLIILLENETLRETVGESLFQFSQNNRVSIDSKEALLKKLKALPDEKQESVRYIIIVLEDELKH